MTNRDNEWADYYSAFDYFSPDKVRDGCHPRMREHGSAVNAIVLVHGLSDSPYFVSAIADHFFEELGYNVYMPLLHFHGLKEPGGMEGVALEEWKRNVLWSVRAAASRARRVSIGGLSTGGALSFYAACMTPRINGDVLLFSAALRLLVADNGTIGDMVTALLRSRLLPWIMDKKQAGKPLVGENPYRYAYVDADGARELAKLIREIQEIQQGFDMETPFRNRLFAAHSYADKTANIEAILALRDVVPAGRRAEFLIDRADNVEHAEVVLKDDIVVNKRTLEKRNPRFGEMMQAVSRFVRDA